MIPHLTKEELLKRVMALEDGAIIDFETQQLLMDPDDSPEAQRLIKRDCSEISQREITSNNLIREYIETRDNVIDVHRPYIGINPNDLDNPLQIGGIDWKVTTAEKGYFERYCGPICINAPDKEMFFKNLDEWIVGHHYIRTYLYTIDRKYFEGSRHEWKAVVKMTGVTAKEVYEMKNSNPTDNLHWVDYMFATGLFG